MWLLVVFIIVYLIIRSTWRITKAIFKPITDWFYKLAVDSFRGRGFSEEASKAFVSLIIIAIIAAVVLL